MWSNPCDRTAERKRDPVTARYNAQQRMEQLRPVSPLLVLQRQRDANKLLLLGVEPPDLSPAGQSPCSPLPRVQTNLNLDGFDSVLSAPSLSGADRAGMYASLGKAGADIGSRPHSPADFDSAKPDADFTKRVIAHALKRGLLLLSCGMYQVHAVRNSGRPMLSSNGALLPR